jgi:alpha-mannosidase
VRVQFAAPIVAAREVNGAEEPMGDATIAKGALVTDFSPYLVRTFAVKLAAGAVRAALPQSQPVPLSYDRIVASPDGARSAGGFDEAGRSLPAEMLPREILFGGVRFALAAAGQANAVVARGQTISLPSGGFTRVYVLAASAGGDETAAFRAGDNTVELTIQDWSGYVGQWDNRTWNRKQEPVPVSPNAPPGTPARMRTVLEYTGLTPGFIKRAPVAWFASHRHTAEGANEAYAYAYLFAYAIDLPKGATTLTLPSNEKIRILAVTVSDETGEVRPVRPLHDTLER